MSHRAWAIAGCIASLALACGRSQLELLEAARGAQGGSGAGASGAGASGAGGSGAGGFGPGGAGPGGAGPGGAGAGGSGGEGGTCTPEICNGADDDCDGVADEGCVQTSPCADGTREGFLDAIAYPRIAGCSGGFQIAGVLDTSVLHCNREAGNDSIHPTGVGCGAGDLCAEGFHVCHSAADVGDSSPTGCSGAAPIANLFFATGQSGNGCGGCALGANNDPLVCDGCACIDGCAPSPLVANDLFGCGSMGDAPLSACGVLDRFSNNLCETLQPFWSCGNDGCGEAAGATKPTSDGGGVLCCSDCTSPVPETCNGKDDDCDGWIDEDDPGGGGACNTGGLGVCAAGTWHCQSASLVCVPDAQPTVEVCDGLDNDCDGAVDDGLGPCDCEAHAFGGHSYFFCSIDLSWSDALAHCQAAGAHLVTLDDAQENDWVNTTAAAISTGKWWMGFDDLAQEGTWVWQDGSAVSFSGWAPGEPNDAGGNEDCGQLLRFYPDLGWNDEPCGEALFFVCESP